MKPLHLLTSAALLFVLGLVTGLSWPTSSGVRQPAVVQSQPLPSLAQRADLMQARRLPRWAF